MSPISQEMIFRCWKTAVHKNVAYFSPANVPLSVSLVLDTSSSMDEEMVLSKQAAMDFIATAATR